MFTRSAFERLKARLQGPRRFLQVLAGPRQVGKTTLVHQVMEALPLPAHYASADSPTLQDRVWIEQQWDIARLKLPAGRSGGGALLVLDEIQKIPDWSAVIKSLWDADTAARRSLKVVLLGSSPLLMQRGLTESLAGRFELIPLPHWSFAEMREAFGWDLERYLFFGGYPGAASLIGEPLRWSQYIVHSLIETTISRDILLLTRVDKPALLRRLFQLGCEYSGQILSYQKMVGQLQDAGNTMTLAHYLELLSDAGFLAGVQKFSGRRVRQRGSSPKLQVLNTALMTAPLGISLEEARRDREFWGRFVESAVGAHLINESRTTGAEIFYWLERGKEVDFVVRSGRTITTIEVKSGRARRSLPGMNAFRKGNPASRSLLVGGEGISVEEFLRMPLQHWLRG